jgi:GntR family transcriptional regulator, vanillate catabolism transcriptional regulator
MDPMKSGGGAGVVAALRQLIIQGELRAGERVAEIPLAERLGVSRTPVRLAFRTLEQEGLLQKVGKRGLLVREFSEADVLCAIEVRGALEGLAARRLAEQGLPAEVRGQLLSSLEEGARLLAGGGLDESAVDAWSRLNERFHHAIVEAGGGRVIADAIARNNHLPFASADSLVIDRAALDKEYRKLSVAQMHHQLVFDALERRESARAESLMREHACVALHYARLFGLKTSAARGA